MRFFGRCSAQRWYFRNGSRLSAQLEERTRPAPSGHDSTLHCQHRHFPKRPSTDVPSWGRTLGEPSFEHVNQPSAGVSIPERRMRRRHRRIARDLPILVVDSNRIGAHQMVGAVVKGSRALRVPLRPRTRRVRRVRPSVSQLSSSLRRRRMGRGASSDAGRRLRGLSTLNSPGGIVSRVARGALCGSVEAPVRFAPSSANLRYR